MRSAISVTLLAAALAFSAPALATICFDPQGYGPQNCFTSNAGASVSGSSRIVGEGSFFSSDSSSNTASAGAAINATSPRGATYVADASSDLATGAVHAAVSQLKAGASARTGFQDVVRFTLPRGMTSATVTASWTLEGANDFVEGLSFAGLGSQTFFLIDQLSERFGNVYVNYGLAQAPARFAFFDNSFYRAHFTDFELNGGHSITLTSSFEVTAGNLYRISQAVDSYAYAYQNSKGVPSDKPSSANYGNTAFFTLSLPTGVSFTSASGTLLSDPYGGGDTPGGGTGGVSPVPEPATWAMLLAGFAATGAMLRRRQADPHRQS